VRDRFPPVPVSDAADRALREVLDRDDPDIVGVVLSGSVARGMATEHSDVDVYVVRSEVSSSHREVLRSQAIDEIPTTLAELEDVAPFSDDAYWYRWSFAYARVLRDDTGGRVAAAVQRQATLTPEEQDTILLARLGGAINLPYRALKADRDGRVLERRLDAAESVPWVLDVIFALEGRVRPYNKYLAWELRTHPLSVPEWSADTLLPHVERMLHDGDPASLRAVYAVMERECRRHDRARGSRALADDIDSWGAELALLRGHRRRAGREG
jgi:predicted nucleotidyltransferase